KAGGMSGQIVLGQYPEYIELADTLNAQRFNIPSEVWRNMSDDERWKANQKFLDRADLRGDKIILATSPNDADPDRIYWRELEFMAEKGYQIAPDGRSLQKR